MFRTRAESPAATRAPRRLSGRKAGALAVGFAVALLGTACSPANGSAEGQARPTTAAPAPEAATPTQGNPSPEASKTREGFPAEVREALAKASYGARCRLAAIEDNTRPAGQGGGEGTAGGPSEVGL